MRPLLVLLVALLAVGAATVPVSGFAADAPSQTAPDTGDSPRITFVANTTNHLSIPDDAVRTSGYDRPSLDVGVAVATGSRRMHRRHTAVAFEGEFFQLDTDRARNRLLDRVLSGIESRESALNRRNERTIRRYANGEISTAEFLRTRALIDAESRQLTAQLERIRKAEQTTPDYSLSEAQRFRIEDIRGVLKTYRGPISHRLTAGTTGEAVPQTVYLQTSSDGYMLASVRGQEYTRETYLGSEREPTLVDQFAKDGSRLRAANDRAEDLYPWLYSEQLPGVQTYGRTGIYQIRADHPNGRLTAYLDGGTTNVFFETQEIELSTVRTNTVATRTNDSVRVRVSRSYGTGPLLVVASDNATGVPVRSTVAINGQPVGSTGSDGTLWSVEPREAYTVTVTTADGDRVTVPVE